MFFVGFGLTRIERFRFQAHSGFSPTVVIQTIQIANHFFPSALMKL